MLRGPRSSEFLAWYGAEEDNLRAMLDRLTEHAPAESAEAVLLLFLYWVARNALPEGRERIDATLQLGNAVPAVHRADLLRRLADLEERLGQLDAAEEAAIAATEQAAQLGDARIAAHALLKRATSPSR